MPCSAHSQACWAFDGSCLFSNGSRACCADRSVGSYLNMPVELSAKKNSLKMVFLAFLLLRSSPRSRDQPLGGPCADAID